MPSMSSCKARRFRELGVVPARPFGHELCTSWVAEMSSRVRKGARGDGSGGGGVRLVPGLALRAGQTIAGKYRVEELIGSGASGVVVSARNIHLRERVAIKMFASYTDGQEALLRRRVEKARLASTLRGPHVARIVDIGVTEDATPYVATEWLEGATLDAELADRERLPIDEAARWVLEACEGLAEAHAIGLVHGDLKPQNILLSEPKRAPRRPPQADGEAPPDPRVLKILDFGTTSPLDAIGDQSASAFFGSPAFLAPEQVRGESKVDARADVWALGVLLYAAVSGTLPFEADTVSGVLVAVVRDAPALLTEAPYGLARLVHHCLDKDPARRPQDVAELAAELAPFAGTEGARAAARVRAALEAPRPPEPLVEASASGSLPPVSMPSEPPRRSLPSSAPSAETTKPSRRVIAQRHARGRASSGALVGVALALAMASWATTRSWTRAVPSPAAADELPAVRPEAPAPPAMRAPAAPPSSVAAPPLAATRELSEPAISFGPGSPPRMTPTPLAAQPTPLATQPTSAPVAPPFVLPAPTAWRAPAPYKLPPGLPRTRDALPSK
jgi:eukaryotic-like serine/threonine-protein kinase